jgi:hypothetical protein
MTIARMIFALGRKGVEVVWPGPADCVQFRLGSAFADAHVHGGSGVVWKVVFHRDGQEEVTVWGAENINALVVVARLRMMDR